MEKNDNLHKAKDAKNDEFYTRIEDVAEELRHLLTFKFKKHSRYNLSDERLKMLEKAVQEKARYLLESV